MVCITQTVKNIIIQFDINYNQFEEEYENFLAKLDTDELRKEVNIPETDRIKKNRTFDRGLYYLFNGNLKYNRIKIQKLHWTSIIDGEEKKIYLSVFPSFIIKYNKVSVDTIEYISNNCRKGEDIFTVIDDPDCVLPSEDLLHRACQKVNDACISKNYASSLNAQYTEVYAISINIPNLIMEMNKLRYPASYELYRTGKIYIAKSKRVLATLNWVLHFLR